MNFDIKPISMKSVIELCEKYHGYGSAGNSNTYAFGVYEGKRLVVAYSWQPPPPGSALSVCPIAPYAVLALSRMVAVPREERLLRHISKPLRYQMKRLIDRTRYPVLITYSDRGQGHTGHVYKCAGWEKTIKSEVPYYISNNKRVSIYNNGSKNNGAILAGYTIIDRWEHWEVPYDKVLEYMSINGWKRIPVMGKYYKSGNQAFTISKS